MIMELALVAMSMMMVKVVTVMETVLVELVMMMIVEVWGGRHGVGDGNDGRAVIGNSVIKMEEMVLVEGVMVVMMVKVELAFMMVKSQ